MKWCPRCQSTKSKDQFYRHYGHKDGLRAHCIPCIKLACKRYNLRHSIENAQYRKRYRLANLARVHAVNKKWRKNNRLYAWKRREWCRQHPDRCRLNAIKWRKKNPEQYNATCHSYRARKYGAPGHFTAHDIIGITTQQKDMCYYCHRSLGDKSTIDHKRPLARGGSNWPRNLCIACGSCNSSKSDMTEAEFKMWRQINCQIVPV